MDYRIRPLIFICLFSIVSYSWALPKIPNFSVSRSGSVSTYKVADNAPYQPIFAVAPTSAGKEVLNLNYSAGATSYLTTLSAVIADATDYYIYVLTVGILGAAWIIFSGR